MKLNLRVRESLVDLEGYNRVAVEDIGSRRFLVGVRHSGRRLALFVLKPALDAAAVITPMEQTLNAGRRVCVLSAELLDIADDAEAVAVLDAHNRELESERDAVERPHTLGTQPVGTADNG